MLPAIVPHLPCHCLYFPALVPNASCRCLHFPALAFIFALLLSHAYPVITSTPLLLPSYVPCPCPIRTQSLPPLPCSCLHMYPALVPNAFCHCLHFHALAFVCVLALSYTYPVIAPLPCSCLDVCSARVPHVPSHYLHFPPLAFICVLPLCHTYPVIASTALLLPSYVPCPCGTRTQSLPLLPSSCLHMCPALVPHVPSHCLHCPALAFICALPLSHTYPDTAFTSLLLPSYVPCPCPTCVLPLSPLPCICLHMCPALVPHVSCHCPHFPALAFICALPLFHM